MLVENRVSPPARNQMMPTIQAVHAAPVVVWEPSTQGEMNARTPHDDRPFRADDSGDGERRQRHEGRDDAEHDEGYRGPVCGGGPDR